MAGIGFNLEKLMQGGSFTDSVKAHLYSVIICAGPWLMSVLTIFLINYLAKGRIDLYELAVFRSSIIYVYAFSLIVVGVFQLSLTRYLADRLYTGEQEAMVPALNTSTVWLLAMELLPAIGFFLVSEESLVNRFLIVMICFVISILWLVMLFLTALRDYKAITISYFLGAAVAIVGSWYWGGIYGLTGYFLGYFVGHFAIVLFLTARIYIEFPTEKSFDREMWGFLRKNPSLILMGLFYNLGIWVDKFIFWMKPDALEISNTFRAYPAYDGAVFFAFMTIIPALSIFMIQIETDFYRHYRRYYGAIIARMSHSALLKRRKMISQSLARSVTTLLKYQGVLSLLCITFAPEIAGLCHLKAAYIPIFRILVLGAFVHSLMLIEIILILYFDFKALALGVSTLFLVLNFLFSLLTSVMPPSYYGYGYFAACLISLMVGYFIFHFKVNRLEYLTFAMQPIAAHREEEVY